MELELAGSPVALAPNDEQLGGADIELAAFDGEIAYGQFPIDDPVGDLSVYNGRSFLLTEGSTVVIDGFVIDQDRNRGGEPGGDAVENRLSVADPNALLDGFRVVRNRPSETDYARVMAFAALDVPAFDTAWVFNTETVTLAAKAYSSDGGWTSELIPDLVESTGKTLFVHDKAAGGRCLHYHNLTSGHDCGLVISDVLTDVDYVTTWAPSQVRRMRTSIDLRNDVEGIDQDNRTSTATDSSSITAHDADGLQHQALVTFEAINQADLDVKTAAYLASNKDDYTTWSVAIGPLDAAALALIRVGDIITCTSTVMGLTASGQRIAHMTLTPWTGKDGPRPAASLWEATLELGAPVRRRRRGRPAKVIGPPPVTPFVCIPTDFTVPFADSVTFDPGDLPYDWALTPISRGGWAEIDEAFSGEQHATTLTTPGGGGYMTLYDGATYQVAASGFPLTEGGVELPIFSTWGWINIVGLSLPGGPISAAIFDMGMWPDFATTGVTNPSFGFQYAEFTKSGTSTDVFGYVRAVNDVAHNSRYWASEIVVTYVGGPDPRFVDLGPCSNGHPAGGQPVRDIPVPGDGTTTSYTSQFPYRPHTLAVWVNGLDWSAQVVETDPATGDYVLLYPPPLGATVWVRYLAAP